MNSILKNSRVYSDQSTTLPINTSPGITQNSAKMIKW